VIPRFLPFTLALSLAGGIAVAGDVSRAAEPAEKVVRLGFVSPVSYSTDARCIDGFWQRLRELGWVEGQNMVIDERSADERLDRLPALMTEVIERKIDVLVTYSTPGALAAKNATSTVPVVITNMADPIRSGIATNLAHPDGNLTGLSLGWAEGMSAKWLEFLQETVPHLSTVTVIANANPLDNPVVRERVKEVQAAASTRRIKVKLVVVPTLEAVDRALRQARREVQAVLVLGDLFTFEHRGQVATLAAKHRLPVMYPLREYVDSGGLMAYGTDRANMFRRSAEYVDKILRGAKPGDLPIEEPTKFELVVNLKAAKGLGITIPESILMRADEVIR
jgi:putative ABC transport system substrate-binding protein